MARRRRKQGDTTECTCAGRPEPREVYAAWDTEQRHGTYTEHPNHCACEAHGTHEVYVGWNQPKRTETVPHHHFGCALWGIVDSGAAHGRTLWGELTSVDTLNEFRPWTSLLGSPRKSYAQWVKTVSPYPWALWRNWKPRPPVHVESVGETVKRQLSVKPYLCHTGANGVPYEAPYPWTIEKLTPAQRLELAKRAGVIKDERRAA